MAAIIWELNMGDLFRINDYWYRLLKHNKKLAVLEVIGTKEAGVIKTVDLPLDTEISELSVLNKK